MWRLLTIAGVAVLGGLGSESFAQGPERPIRAIGEFANFRSTDTHTYRCDVELWRDGDSVIGLFFAAEGFDADMPAGMLENAKLDSRTGALSFTAKLTIAGAIDLPGLRQEPSRDLFEFSGTLKAAVLRGTLKRSISGSPCVRARGNASSSRCGRRTACFRPSPTPNGSAVLTRS